MLRYHWLNTWGERDVLLMDTMSRRQCLLCYWRYLLDGGNVLLSALAHSLPRDVCRLLLDRFDMRKSVPIW